MLTFSVIVYMPLSSRFSHSTSSRKDTTVKTKRLSLSKSSINVCMLSPLVILFRMYLADARPDKSLLTISRSVGSPSYSLVLWCFLSARTPTRYQYLGVLWKSVSFQTNIYSGSIKRSNQASQWKAKKYLNPWINNIRKQKKLSLKSAQLLQVVHLKLSQIVVTREYGSSFHTVSI